MTRYLFLFLLLSCFPFPSLAELLVEPYIGGQLNWNRTASPGIYFGLPSFGAKIGVNKFGFTLGTELSYTRLTSFSSLRSSNCLTGSDLGEQGFEGVQNPIQEACETSYDYQPYHLVQVGLAGAAKLPFVIDAYGAILFVQAINERASYNGIGLKAGISYFTLPFISINLELQITNFFSCSLVSDDQSASTPCDLSESQPNSFLTGILSVSMPIKTVF